MTPSQLRHWSFQNSQPDQWWLSLDAVTEEIPVTVAEIEERLKSGDYSAVQALHVSQADMENAPWVEVFMPLPMKAPPMMQPPSITAATAALATFEVSATSGTSNVGAANTKGQNIGCSILALMLLLLFGYGAFWMNGIKKEQNMQSAAQARDQERRDAQATEANLKYNREHAQTRNETRAVESASNEWYVGGTLTRAKMSEWNRASYANRLATSADFVARMLGGDMGNLSMDGDIKPMATRLESEISAAYQEGVTDALPVPDVAASCILILKARGVRGFAQ